jgi:hypothetical protein
MSGGVTLLPQEHNNDVLTRDRSRIHMARATR